MAVRNSFSSGIVKNGLILALDAADPINYELNEVEVLVVGGGGGGATGGGGGGAGGLVYNTAYKVTPGSGITVTIGGGGSNTATWGGSGGRGVDSVFGTITALGGGGGSHRGTNGSNNGSGGGDAGGGETINPGTVGQGKNGGLSRNNASTLEDPGGGGGGAGENGESTASTSGTYGDQTLPRPGIAGKGGNGLYFGQFAPFAGSPAGWFAGGGGGSNRDGYGRTGGLGGGGRGGKSPTAGATNTGGGGGGTGYSGYGGGGTSAVGGSGIVIVRYVGPQKATGGNTITSLSGYTVHVFTSNGTFTPLTSASIKSTFYGLQDLSGSNSVSAVALNGAVYENSAGGSVFFDGTNDLIDLGSSKDINLFAAGEDFAISSWFYRENTGNDYGNLIGNYYTNSVTTTNDWQIMVRRSTDPLQLGIYRVGTGYPFSATQSMGTGISLNTWINLVLTRVGSNLSVYVNGSLLQTVTNTDQWGNGTSSNMCIGIDGNRTSEPFGGRVANVLIYKNKGLSSSEVLQNFNAQRRRFGV